MGFVGSAAVLQRAAYGLCWQCCSAAASGIWALLAVLQCCSGLVFWRSIKYTFVKTLKH